MAYSSSEVRKVRVDRMQRRHPLAGRLPGVSPIGQAQIATGEGIAGDNLAGEGLQFAPKVEAASGVQFSSAATDQGSSILSKWDQQAAIALQALGNGDAAQMSSRTGLRHAANLRLAGKLGEQSSVISVLTQRDDAWQVMARAEMQSVHSSVASPVPVLNIQKSPDRPLLDAELTDACWEDGRRIPLTDSGAGTDGTGFLLMTWDDQFLYVAGRMNHLPDGPKPEPRALIENMMLNTVFEIALNSVLTLTGTIRRLDFRIDQTGQTSEDCWGIRNWDPQWFVATNTR